MKKVFLGLGALTLMSVSLFTSCSNNDFTPMTVEEINQQKFEAAFIKQYGNFPSTQNWGFNPISLKSNSEARTRWADNDKNLFGDKYQNVPAPLTDEQKDVVRQWFQANKNPQGIALRWVDFFCQQVYKGGTNPGTISTEIYQTVNRDGQTVTITGAQQMDFLYCVGKESEHINNFNNGDYNNGKTVYPVKQSDGTEKSDMITLMRDYPTTAFGFHDSYGQTNYPDNYVVIPGDRISPLVAGMYFVGFDYSTYKESDGVRIDKDGYYSDWIVRITPGIEKGSNMGRVIAEDLGAGAENSDFDYNDVVFDAKVYNDWNNDGKPTAEITLRAAGGTLPLFVGGVEVHAAFAEANPNAGITTSTMINTNAGVDCFPARFKVVLTEVQDIYSITLNDIPVEVEKNGQRYRIATYTGEAPAKLCVDTDYDWTTERQPIDDKYPLFRQYVGKPELRNTWYKTK